MRRVFIGMVLSLLMVAALGAQSKTSVYEPKTGDAGIIITSHLVPGMSAEYKKLYIEKVSPAVVASPVVRDSYCLISEDESEVLVLLLNDPKEGEALSLMPTVEDISRGRVADQTTERYRVMVAFNEGYYPEVGDTAVVITRHIKEGMFDVAKDYHKNAMIASLAADAFTRYYVVLERPEQNLIIAFSFLKGKPVSDPKVVAVRESGFSKFMERPFEMKNYAFFAINEE
jgi:hypothetical protein